MATNMEQTITQTEQDTIKSVDSSTKLLGCVKWFNNKRGYGFVTYTQHSLHNIFIENYISRQIFFLAFVYLIPTDINNLKHFASTSWPYARI